MSKYVFILTLLFFSAALAQDGKDIDFTEGRIRIEVVPDSGVIKGSVAYDLNVNHPTDSLLISARDLNITRVSLGREPLDFTLRGNDLVIYGRWPVGKYEDLVVRYNARPEQGVYFPGWTYKDSVSGDHVLLSEGGRQVWTQGQGKYTSSWVPSFDDMNEKVKFSIAILFPSGYEVMANGKLIDREDRGEKTLWTYRMKEKVSSYLLAFVAGEYEKQVFRSSSGIPVELYYYPGDHLKAGPTYQYSPEIFEFLENEIGVPYPWEIYRQVPVRDFLYAGMENVGLTVFSDTYITDSIGGIDRSYVNVNAHELAHHWFGNMVTEESGTHHWLQEGFATYYALLTERYLFGDDHYYWKLYDTALKLSALSDQGKGESLLDPGAGSLTFYEKGAWALHILKEKVGARVFRTAVKDMLTQHAFSNINTADLLNSLADHTDIDLSDFREIWLESPVFPGEEAMESLMKNSFVKRYTDCVADSAAAVVLYNDYVQLLKGGAYFPLKQYVLKRAAYWPERLRDSLWSFGIREGDLKTRQGVALAADTIPLHLKSGFESLLDDPSYITNQEALLKLWVEFPEDRAVYLRRTEGIKGFEDRAFRVLWLGLALFTPEYKNNAPELFRELTSYTSPLYHFEVRQQAMNMLYQTGGFTKTSLLNVLEGMDHPAWQFSRFCRNMLDTLVVQPEVRIQLRTLLPELNERQRERLRSQLETAPEPAGREG